MYFYQPILISIWIPLFILELEWVSTRFIFVPVTLRTKCRWGNVPTDSIWREAKGKAVFCLVRGNIFDYVKLKVKQRQVQLCDKNKRVLFWFVRVIFVLEIWFSITNKYVFLKVLIPVVAVLIFFTLIK